MPALRRPWRGIVGALCLRLVKRRENSLVALLLPFKSGFSRVGKVKTLFFLQPYLFWCQNLSSSDNPANISVLRDGYVAWIHGRFAGVEAAGTGESLGSMWFCSVSGHRRCTETFLFVRGRGTYFYLPSRNGP